MKVQKNERKYWVGLCAPVPGSKSTKLELGQVTSETPGLLVDVCLAIANEHYAKKAREVADRGDMEDIRHWNDCTWAVMVWLSRPSRRKNGDMDRPFILIDVQKEEVLATGGGESVPFGGIPGKVIEA